MVKTIQRKENIEMCVDKRVPEFLRKGVVIDTEIPFCVELAFEVIKKLGIYNELEDSVEFAPQFFNQYTTIRYLTTRKWYDEKREEWRDQREFILQVPNKYVPSSKECTHENVIRTVEDIDKLCESMSKKESD